MIRLLSRKETFLVGMLVSIMLLAFNTGVQASTGDAVPFKVIQKIAVDNARSLWGDVYETEAIPYYGLDDEVIAYMFNFSIGKEFPPHDQVIEGAEQARREGRKEERWGVDHYCHLIVSARYSMPTIPAYSKCLSEEFACDRELQQMAKNALSTPTVQLIRIYYITPSQKWYVYSDGQKKVFIRIFPPPTVYSESEFDAKVRQEFGLPEKGDLRSLWLEFEQGKTLSLNIDHLIHRENECCPFYDWSYGCSPTAAAMLLAYWDNYGLYSPNNYARLVDYHFERWDCVQGETDYQVPNLQRELALAMHTDTITGGTYRDSIAPGYVYCANNINDYSFSSRRVYGTSAELFDTLTQEIDAGHPIHASIPGHSICVVGYTDDDYMIARDTWHPPNHYWYYTNLQNVYPVIPSGAYGYTVKVTSPMGDIMYNHNGCGEVWYAGSTYEITWDRDASYGYVIIWYSGDGGHTWLIIEDSTANDGSWSWTIPPGISTSQARIAVNLREDLSVLGCDGSFGNFKISPPAAITVTPDYFDVTLIQGATTTRTMTIGNTGSDTLHFSITDATGDLFGGTKEMGICVSDRTNSSLTDLRKWYNPERNMGTNLESPVDLSPNLPSKNANTATNKSEAAIANTYDDVTPYPPASSTLGSKSQGDSIFGFSCGGQSIYCIGVEFAGNYFYVSAGQSELKVFEYDHSGRYTGFSFDQFRTSGWGWRDLAWDGLHLYGGDDDGNVTEFGTDGTDYGDFAGPPPLACIRALAYDPVEDVFYTANWGSDIYKFSKTDPNIASYPQSPDTFSIYGMAYDGESPGGPCLWISEQTTNSVRQWSLTTHSYTGVAFSASGIAGGCAYSKSWSYPLGVLFYMAQTTPDHVIGYQITESADWLSEYPETGSIPPGGSMDITVTFDATALVPHDYDANIIISSNDPENPVVTVPVDLAVVPPDTMYIWAGWTATPPTIDGNIDPTEWASATCVDISDTLGQPDSPDPLGTAYLYVMNDGDRLYMAVDYPADTTLDNSDQIGFYFDENNDDAWATDSSEGNYWFIWSGDSTRITYRAIPLWYYVYAPPGVVGGIGNTPNLQYETSMPFGTEIYELTAGPDDIMGFFCYALNHGLYDFGGWWQQTMPYSKWTDPAYYGRVVLAPSPVAECTLRVVDTWGVPGSNDNPMDIELNNTMAVGGVQFTLTFDGSLLSTDSAATTPRTSHMDLAYNTWADSIKVLIFSMTGDSILPCSGPIVEVFFDVDTSAVVEDSTLVYMKDAVVSDPFANPISLTTFDGWFKFGMKGDINGDGLINILDLVRCVNIILGIPPPPTSYEQWAADVNNDGLVNVVDVVAIVNIILGTGKPLAGRPAPEMGQAVVSIGETSGYQGEWITVPIEVSNSVPVAGVQVSLEYDPKLLTAGNAQTTERSQGFEVAYNASSGDIVALIYSLSGDVIKAGHGSVITIPVKVKSNANDVSLRLKQVVLASKDANSIPMVVEDETIVISIPPKTHVLLQNYPNPCYSETKIAYQLPKSSKVTLNIYNSTGQLVKTLVDEDQQPGYHKAQWNGKDKHGKLVASGIYFYRMEAGEFTSTKKLVRLK